MSGIRDSRLKCSDCGRCRTRSVGDYTYCFCNVFQRTVSKEKADYCPMYRERWKKIGHFC